jgi:hypothetical protein
MPLRYVLEQPPPSEEDGMLDQPKARRPGGTGVLRVDGKVVATLPHAAVR